MKNFYGSLFLVLNIVCTSKKITNPIIVIIGLLILFLLARESKKQGNSTLIILLELLCYTWSSGWRNIFGGYVGEFHLPWFYLIGVIITIYTLFIVKIDSFKFKDLFLFFMLILVGLVPLVNSYNISEGITEYITMSFMFIVVLCIDNFKIKITKIEYNSLIKSYVNAMLITSIAIIAQYSIQEISGFNIIDNVPTALLGGHRMGSSLMFGDMSSASIFIILAALVIISKWKEFKFPLVQIIIIVGGTGVTSTRTGVMAFFIIVAIYIIFEKKSIEKKAILILLFMFLVIFALTAIGSVRDIDNVGFLNDNGRFSGYIKALEIYFNSNILFGIGFGDAYLSYLMNSPVPHFSLLKILVQTGISYFIFIILYLIQYLKKAGKENIGFYLLLGSIIGSFFIPGLFSAKFLTIILSIICVENKMTTKNLEENIRRENVTNNKCYYSSL